MLYIIFAIVAGWIKGGRIKREKQREEAEAKARWEEIYEETAEGERVRKALKDAYFGLRKQNAAGFGTWLTACMSRKDYVPANVAIEAMNRTAAELNTYCQGRYNLDCIYAAINSIC